MKFIENPTTWNKMLSAVETVISENPEQSSQLSKEEIQKECEALALYSYKKDIQTGQMSEMELDRRMDDGELFSGRLFVRLARHFILEEQVEGKERSRHIALMQTMHTFLGSLYYYKADMEVMQKLCRLGRQYPERYLEPMRQDVFLKRYIDAALYLKEKGFDIRIEAGEVYFDEQLGQELFTMLDRKIATVGGNYVLEKVFMEHIGQKYIPDFDRFILSRNVDKEKNIPLNLLINLAAKHLKAYEVRKESESREKELREIFRLAEAWLEISGVQGESGMEYSMMKLKSFPLYLKNELIFDKMCIPMQYCKRFVLLALDYLIKPWFDAYSGREYSYREYWKAADYVLDLKLMGGYIDIDDMKKRTGISRSRLLKILTDVSWEAREVNAAFNSLESPMNLQRKPLIRFPMDTWFFIDQHFCGMGFYHTAYELIKGNLVTLDRLQGPVVENMLIDEMKAKHYHCMYGKYPAKNGINNDECDLVLLGKKMNFFEIKKRLSVDEFDAIDDVSLLRSLGLGMVKAQKQCFGHERYLKKNSTMTLEGEDKSFTLTYDSEKMPSYKISVCLSEYSFLTSKSFSMALMEILLLGDFTAVDTSRQYELETINEIAGKLRTLAAEISSDDRKDARSLAFCSLFCSMQQVLTAVWCCETEEEFLDVVRDWMYTTDKTLDPYISLLLHLWHRENPEQPSIRKSAIEMLEKSNPYAMYVG